MSAFNFKKIKIVRSICQIKIMRRIECSNFSIHERNRLIKRMIKEYKIIKP